MKVLLDQYGGNKDWLKTEIIEAALLKRNHNISVMLKNTYAMGISKALNTRYLCNVIKLYVIPFLYVRIFGYGVR